MFFTALSSGLIPERTPSLWRCLGVAIGGLAAAGLVRWLLLLTTGAFPPSIYFPALLVITAYAGLRWGLASLAVAALTIGVLLEMGPTSTHAGVRDLLGLAAFTVAGLLSVLVAASLREAIVDLRGARRQRRQAETALADHAARLRLAEQAGGLGVWDWDLDTGRATLTPRGLDGDEDDGDRVLTPSAYQTFLDQVHPDDRRKMREEARRAIVEGQSMDLEYRLSTRRGERWIHTRGEVVRDPSGRAVRLVGYNFDVTERRQTEDRLRESEARFRALADSAPAPMWVTRLDRKREFVNRAYVELMDAPYEEAINFDWRTLLHPEDIDRVTAESIAGEASLQPFMLEGRYRVAGNDYRWLRSFSRPRFDPDGALVGFIGIAVDVTDSKRAEGDLKRLNEILAERIQEALAERDQAQAALIQSQKLEAVGQLTGGVAHDFNNLLTVVIGALDIVARNPDDAPRRARLLEAALAAARRGEKLTGQLLAFARRQPLRTEIAHVDALIRQDEPLIRRAVGEAVRLGLRLEAGDSLCRLDVAQFEAALLNLVVNARDATPDGGLIEIVTTCETLTAPRGELAAGRYLRVTVADTGPGMDEATVARVFEPFFTTKAVGKGTGLGLSQVYGFARQSSGDVDIETAPGQGARVSLLLPFLAPAAVVPGAAGDQSPTPDHARPTRSLMVLIVEDDAAVGDLIRTMLEELGHQADLVETVDQAIAVLDGNRDIDLLLSDVIMPGGRSGVDLANEARVRWPALPVILSSGYTGDTLASAEAAPWPLLRKPYTLEALAAAVEAAVARRISET